MGHPPAGTGPPPGGLGDPLGSLVAGSAVPMFVARSSDGVLVCLNASFARIVGRPLEQLLGCPFLPLVGEPSDPSAGRLRGVLSGAASMQDRIEFVFQQAGGAVRTCLASITLVRQEGDALIVGSVEDVTEHQRVREALERAQDEVIQSQERLVHAEKMASLGRLVAGVAHEIKTPIGAVASMHHTLVKATEKLSRLVGEAEPEPDQAAKVEKLLNVIQDANRVITDGTDRITTIVKRLKSFARIEVAELEDADLNEGLRDTLSLINHEFKHDFTVHRALGDLPVISCFPGQLKQVFVNLLMNARQAMPKGGEIWIRSRFDDAHVYVEIQDSGTGIPADLLDRIFEPGFTTKTASQGTGLGLWICQKIADAHHGDLSVKSEVGRGATFTLRIPRDLRARLASMPGSAPYVPAKHE